MTARFDVIGLGTILVDHQVVLPEFPAADSKVEATWHRKQVGGPVPTALAMLRQLNRTCSFIGKWVDDDAGRYVQRNLAATELDASFSVIESVSNRSDAATGFAHVWVDQQSGSRTVAAWRGGFAPIAPQELPSPFPRCDGLHLDGWSSDAAIAAAQNVRDFGGHVFLDTGSPKPGVESLIPWVDTLSCPERFLRQFEPLCNYSDDESASRALLDMGPSTVITTYGDRGAIAYQSGRQKIVQPAFPVAAVDTTGAGDVFCGAVIHGRLQGWALERTLEFAAVAAALKCEKMGNRAALPSLSDIRRGLESLKGTGRRR